MIGLNKWQEGSCLRIGINYRRDDYSRLILALYFPLPIIKGGTWKDFDTQNLSLGKRILFCKFLFRVRSKLVEGNRFKVRFDTHWKPIQRKLLYTYE